jgi:hypothetical protein
MIGRWLREPLLHFLVLGIALFVVDGYLHRGRGGVESSKQIALTLDALRQLDRFAVVAIVGLASRCLF